MPQKFFFQNERSNRILKNRKNLRVSYPNETKMKTLAQLAKVKTCKFSRFSQHIRNNILDACLDNDSMKGASTPKTKSALSSVANEAATLATTLRAMDLRIAGGTGGPKQTAGTNLNWELAKTQEELLARYVELLDSLQAAATRAAELLVSRRGPKGAGGNKAFDFFVEGLTCAAIVHGKKWSAYRDASGEWKGPILEALHLLKPYLPIDFFPRGELGRSVTHIQERLEKRRAHTEGTLAHRNDA
jgi:hypothetical protein